ncbi:SAM-dependent methyltransferase [Kitasatospora cheerisanensis]|uniref:SAM-dependent methyltransferase n=1 Tax=Kitasatospora cheerisanensis TaxID=81942 RepID=UPI000564AD36|nr:SAM-dependent methyltransferase [Kitasatospora cheerisanensis]
MADDTPAVDRSKPSVARIYDYLLGGHDNYPVDREIGDYFLRELPGSVAVPVENRRALIRAVAAMATTGIRQFLDLGSGLPTADNVHQVARRHRPDARVVYVDNDPTVLAHGRALLAADGRSSVVLADLREPAEIRRRPEVADLIDFDQPVGLVFSAVLHHLDDAERPAELVRWWTERVPSGSQLYLSHFRSGGNEECRLAERKLQGSLGRGRWRTDREILDLFGGLELLEPGLVSCSAWRPETVSAPTGSPRREPTVWEQMISCALARKP